MPVHISKAMHANLAVEASAGIGSSFLRPSSSDTNNLDKGMPAVIFLATTASIHGSLLVNNVDGNAQVSQIAGEARLNAVAGNLAVYEVVGSVCLLYTSPSPRD